MEQQKKKTSWGKKILIGIGVLVVIGIIGSQLEDKQPTTQETKTNDASETRDSKKESNDEYKKIGDQIDVGNFSYVVNNVHFKKSVGDQMLNQVADGIYLIVDLTFRNNDNEEHTLDNSFFKLTDESGTEFSSSTDAESALEMSGQTTLFLKQCNPNITKRGYLVFEVPEKKIYDLQLSGGFWSGKKAIVKLSN